MNRPDDLKIKLHHDECHHDDEDGSGYILTSAGSSLWKLSKMWSMTYEEVVEKLAYDAVIQEEEKYIVNGNHIPPHAWGGYTWAHESEIPDGEVVYH